MTSDSERNIDISFRCSKQELQGLQQYLQTNRPSQDNEHQYQAWNQLNQQVQTQMQKAGSR